ncbi:MAG: hypothetical protein WC441_01895 [Patescibacteria group bacterium]
MKNHFGQKILNNLLQYTANDGFRKDILAIKKKFLIPDEGVDDEYIKKYGHDAVACCLEDLEELRIRYKLNEHYGVCLMYIIIFARMPDENILKGFAPCELITHKERSGLHCAAIKIYPETTYRDIQNNWSKISNFKKEVYGYEIKNLKSIKNAKRDLFIRALKRWGVTNKETANIINSVFPQMTTIGYSDVSKIMEKNRYSAAKKLNKIPKIK